MKRVQVNLLPKLKLKRFVQIAISNTETRVARIESAAGKSTVQVRFYLQREELPEDLDPVAPSGERITFLVNEIVRDHTLHEYPLETVMCPCTVYFIPEHEDVLVRRSRRCFVCRYKLVESGPLRLEPIPLHSDSNDADHFLTDDEEELGRGNKLVKNGSRQLKPVSPNSDSEGENHFLTDEEEEFGSASKVGNISARLGELLLSADNKRASVRPGKLPATQIDENEQVSPSKRRKLIDEPNSNYLTESPVSAARGKDRIRRSTVTKNLNCTFLEEGEQQVESENVEMNLRNAKPSRNRPLQELNDNVSGSPAQHLQEKILTKAIQKVQGMSTPTTRRKSILKAPGSETGKPHEDPKSSRQLKTNSSFSRHTEAKRYNRRGSPNAFQRDCFHSPSLGSRLHDEEFGGDFARAEPQLENAEVGQERERRQSVSRVENAHQIGNVSKCVSQRVPRFKLLERHSGLPSESGSCSAPAT